MTDSERPGKRSNFRRFFIRGLAIVLPTVLTIWLLLVAFSFVDQRIGQPINAGIRELVIRFTDWPPATEQNFRDTFEELPVSVREDEWQIHLEKRAQALGVPVANLPRRVILDEQLQWQRAQEMAVRLARRNAFETWWNQYKLGTWPLLNLIGVLLAVVLVYIVGAFLSRSIGNRLWKAGEDAIHRVPLVGRVYPAFKQITDFVFGDDSEDKLQFNRVVAVQYPRKGLWSVGLVTGNTMRTIQDRAGRACLTVFVPSSPTPFTGYVITVPIEDTVDLPVTVEDALKFAVSGGVVVPPQQMIPENPRELGAQPSPPAPTAGSASTTTGNGSTDAAA